MNQWFRRLRGMLGMGLAWAIGGIGIGGLFELIDNIAPGALPFIRDVDMWPQTLAIPFFFGGIMFATVLMVVGSRHRFGELSLGRFAAWGAATGLLLGALGVAAGAPLYFIGIATVGSVVGASASLVMARLAERRERPALEHGLEPSDRLQP
jgi:hypothetical protein